MRGVRRQRTVIEVNALDKGLDLVTPPSHLPPGAMRQADNWRFKGPALVTRPGYSRLTSEPVWGIITGLTRYYPSVGPPHLIVAIDSGPVYRIVSPDNSPEQIASPPFSGVQWHFTQFDSLLVGANGLELKLYNGQQWASLGSSAPAARYLIPHANRLAVANTPDFPSRVHFSNVGNPQSWPTGLYRDFEPNDHDEITGLAVLHGILVVFKQNSVWVMYGTEPSNYTPQQMATNLGCIAPRSIQVIAGRVYWLSNDGVWSFDGTTFEKVSAPIDPLLGSNPTLAQAAGGQWGDYYLLSYSEGNSENNNAILVYNIPRRAWLRDTAPAVSMFARWSRHDDLALSAAQAKGGHVYRLNEGFKDDGSPITSHFHTGSLGHDAGRVHQFRHVHVGTDVDTDTQLNLAVTAHTRTGSHSIGTPNTQIGLPSHMQGMGLDVQLSCTDSNAPVTVHSLVIERVTRRLR